MPHSLSSCHTLSVLVEVPTAYTSVGWSGQLLATLQNIQSGQDCLPDPKQFISKPSFRLRRFLTSPPGGVSYQSHHGSITC